MKYCINCGADIGPNAELCVECGANQTKPLTGGNGERGAGKKYCMHCGELVDKWAETCPECRVEQRSLSNSSGDAERVTAGVLAVVLGSFGAHKFYQGNVTLGLLYLCLFWTLVPAVVSLAEGALMLFADERTYETKYADGGVLGSSVGG